MSLDELISEDHPARLVWELTGRFDYEALLAKVAAREGTPGHPQTDPHILVALWLYATLEGIGSARELARLREQLFVANVDGTKPVQLTRDDYNHEDPAWSPDGKKIAFVSMQDGLERIAMMDPDGSHVEALTPRTVRAIHPHWAPDSARVAYCTDDDLQPPKKNESEIDAIDLKTRKITRLITGGINTYPAWSPDGKRLAFRKIIGELNSEVFLANADGTDAHNLTNHPAFDGWPAWSPDGSQLAFASNRNSSYQVFVMKPDGSDVQQVANTEGRATSPAWSRDGSKIYFSNCRNVDLGHDCAILVAPSHRTTP